MRYRKQFVMHGQPLCGGQLYVDDTAYFDEAMLIPAPVPLVLDSFGRVQFYTKSAVTYRLEDMRGNPVVPDLDPYEQVNCS